MDVAFLHAGIGNAHELWARTHGFDILATGIAHGGLQATTQLVHNLH